MSPLGPLVAFLGCTDLERAREFYVETVGLVLVDQVPSACVFNVHGTMLRVTKVAEAPRAGHTVLGWDVIDIAEAMSDLRERGVEFRRYEELDQDDDGVWTTPRGDRVAWFEDPDGNVLSLAQFAPPQDPSAE
ncbi:MAG: VOC family protein [Acidimicrobiales bacterium]